MALKRLSTTEQANKFLPTYFRQHNKKFAVRAASAEDAHREKPAKLKLADVCYKISTRKLMNDWTVSYKNMTLQISKQSAYPPSKTNIIVREILDGQIELYYRDRKVQYKIIQNNDISTLLNDDISTLV